MSKLFIFGALLLAILQIVNAQDKNDISRCPNYRPEEVSYPTPYITAQTRSERCQALFSRFNSTGTANINFIGQNTYHNPCKIECGLCVEDELPDENEDANIIRSYPPHISLKDGIVQCPEDVEIFEQYMQDGIRCGPFHMCEKTCCVAKPEMFPKSSKRIRTKLNQVAALNNFSQDIPPEWTLPLTCEEEGYFRNPNDCHKFYRCYKTGLRSGFSRTLFNCNPSDLVFDEQMKVCMPLENDGRGNICELYHAPELSDDY